MNIRDYRPKCDAIGRRIRMEREAMKITQEKLAEMTGMGTDHIRNIEYGEKGMSVTSLVRISMALDLSVDYVIHGTRPVKADGSVDPEKREKIESTVRLMEHMDAEQCSNVESLVRMLRKALKKTE